MLVGIGVTVLVVLAAGFFAVVRPYFLSRAAEINPDCALIVPANPLSAQGLATPYQLLAADPANGPCNEANADQASFVQGAVFDPATGQISVYNPLVIDQGTKPAVAPVVPTLPTNAVVALWFGSNADTLTLKDTNGSLGQGKCVNGVDGSIFGQFAYCNAPAFFTAASQAITAGTLVPPPLGMGKDGQICPTVREFSVVDQDQSDNVTTTYLTTADGTTAQMNAANVQALQNTQTRVSVNGSDNRLLDVFIDGALGCSPWTVPDLADPGQMATALPLNELQAAAHPVPPVALVPANDPMVLNNDQPDLNKLNLYRIGVGHPKVANLGAASGKQYCQNYATFGAQRIAADAPFTVNGASPDPAVGNNLFTFLAQRFVDSYGADNLKCNQLLGKDSPIATTQNADGVAISATLNGKPINTQQPAGGNGGTPTTPDCNVNGTKVAGCAGTVTINGQTCTLAFANGIVNLTCPNAPAPGNNGAGNTGANNTVPGGSNPNPLTFNNVGVSNDDNTAAANFDGGGSSYSAQALQNVGITPGKTLTFNGVNFFWPDAAVPATNNVVAKGQVIPITPVQGATTLAFLGSSSNGPSFGNATITYSDGTTQTFKMLFSDWTLNAGRSSPSAGNQSVAEMPYRNTPNGMQAHRPHVFYIGVALMAGKTVQSVTLPTTVNQGKIHVFAIATK
jgi:hypothetical protein